MSTWGHWENRKPGPGYGGAYNTGKPENNDPTWAYAWENGFTWVETVGNAPFTGGVGSLTGPVHPGIVNAGYSVPGADPNGFLPIIIGRRRISIPIIRQHDYTVDGAPWFWRAVGIIGEGEISSVSRLWCKGTEVFNTGVPGFSWAVSPGSPAGEPCAFLSNSHIKFATRDGVQKIYDLPEAGMTSIQIYDNTTLLTLSTDYTIAAGAGINGRDQITFVTVGVAGHFAKASWISSLPNTAYIDIRIDSGSSLSWQGWTTMVPGGPENITFEAEVYGRLLYDPRDVGQLFSDPSTWLVSDNPVIAIRDIVSNPRWRVNYTVNDTSFGVAADVCDSTIGTPSAKRFLCNDLILAEADVSVHLAQLCLACNGTIFMGINGVELFVDVENSGSAVMTLDTARNFLNTKFETLSARDSPTQIIATYPNIALDYKEDTLRVPPTPSGDVRTASYGFNAITDAVHVARAAAYILNQNIVTPVRMSGQVSQAGIILGPGARVDVTTSDGPFAAPFLVTEVILEDGAYSIAGRQYDSSVYSDTPIDETVPVPTGQNFIAPPPPAAPRFITRGGFGVGLAMDPPRTYTRAGPYGTALWTVTDDDSHDGTKINDNDLTSVAVVTNASSSVITYLDLDLGVGVTEAFGRFAFWTDRSIPSSLSVVGPVKHVQYSDDGVTWVSALSVDGDIEPTILWQDAAIGGIYQSHIEIPSAVGPHRYWRFGFSCSSGGLINIYEVQAWTFIDWVGDTPAGYEIHFWPGGGFTPTFFGPDRTQQIILSTPDLPTDASPFPIDTPPIEQQQALDATGWQGSVTQLWSGSVGSRGAYNSSWLSSTTVVPFYAFLTHPPSWTASPNKLIKAVDSNTLGNSSVTDDGTNVGFTEPIVLTEQTLPALSDAGTAKLLMDEADHKLKVSTNGGAYAEVPGAGGGGTIDGSGTGGIVAAWVDSDTLGDGDAAKVPYDDAAAVGPLVGETDVQGALDALDAAIDALPSPGPGTVTSVGVTVPSNLLAVTGVPIIGAGTAALTMPVRAKNKFLGGPISGADAEPAFREIDSSDVVAVSPLTVFRAAPEITGAMDGVNGAFVLPETPTSSRIGFYTDNMRLQGGRDYTRVGARVYLASLANRPRRNVIADYVIRGPADGGGGPEDPPTLTAATWTGVSVTTRNWNSVAFAPIGAQGRWVAVSGLGTGYIMYSDDGGATWTETQPVACQPLMGVAWSGSLFVAVGDGDNYWSADGITWTLAASAAGSPFVSVAAGYYLGAERIVSVANSNAYRAAYTTDGLTWYASLPPADSPWSSVCYSHSLKRFLAVSDAVVESYDVMYSDDGGVTWTGVASGTGNFWKAVCWSPYLELFVAVTDDTGNGYNNQVMTSPTGAAGTWTLRTTPNSGHNWWGLCWSESRRLFVAVGSPTGGGTQEAMVSADGLAWSLQTTPTNSRFTSVCSGDGVNLILAVGYPNSGNQQVMYSSA